MLGAEQFDRLFHDQFEQGLEIQLGQNRAANVGDEVLMEKMFQQLAIFRTPALAPKNDMNPAWLGHAVVPPMRLIARHPLSENRLFLLFRLIRGAFNL
jgi:hypothetical protein